jgi:hypothetical protein
MGLTGSQRRSISDTSAFRSRPYVAVRVRWVHVGQKRQGHDDDAAAARPREALMYAPPSRPEATPRK